jgi:hypothetical protein
MKTVLVRKGGKTSLQIIANEKIEKLPGDSRNAVYRMDAFTIFSSLKECLPAKTMDYLFSHFNNNK